MDKNELKKVKFVELRAQGKTFSEISKEINISKPTLIEWSDSLRFELSNSLELYKEKLTNELRLNFRRKIEIKSKILASLERAIEQIDWSKTSPEKLVNIIDKIYSDSPKSLVLKNGQLPSHAFDNEWES